MANMGLGRLVLVEPRVSKPELMEAAATRQGAGRLREAKISASLEEALAPYAVVVGTTARIGAQRGRAYPPRLLLPSLLAGDPPPPAALVFGTEREGLSTGELRLCSKTLTIPTAEPESSSLNLSQAVLIVGYELLLAAGGEPAPPPPIKPATFADRKRALDDLQKALEEIGFLPRANPERYFQNVKKIFDRGSLARGECDLIMGICRQLRYRLRRSPPDGGQP
jgi:tRNA/rRNA methyltransferase